MSFRPWGKDGIRPGGWHHLNTIADASHVLENETIRQRYTHWGLQAHREYERFWFGFLGVTRPLRHRLGLRQENLSRLFFSCRGSPDS